jgi:uncharacterized protein (DUF58 family)
MSLTGRSLLFASLTVLLAVVGLWGADPLLARLWQLPAALLMLGLAAEGFLQRRVRVEATPLGPGRLRLGRPVSLALHWSASRPAVLRFMFAAPDLVEAPASLCTVLATGAGADVRREVVPVRLGRGGWPALRARVRGALGLAWWPRSLPVAGELTVEPDLLGGGRRDAPAAQSGVSRRPTPGSGAELHELRDYRPGDPLRSIDWKASARLARWIAREFVAEQHNEIVIMIDVGRTSGVAVGPLTRLGHFVNAACRFAEHAVGCDDRVGLVTFADRPLAVLAPGNGEPAVRRLRAALAGAASLPFEGNPLAAVARVRALCRHRALVVLMLDLDDPGRQGQLRQAVRLLRPKHLPVVCGLLNPEVAALRVRTARRWLDPFVSLAAAEELARLRASAAALRQLGAPVVLAAPRAFEDAVFAAYDEARERRRV